MYSERATKRRKGSERLRSGSVRNRICISSKFAHHWRVRGPRRAPEGLKMSKESSKKKSGFRTIPDPVPSEKTQGPESKSKAPVGPADKLKFEDLGPLPSGYGEMFLIARDPHWLFTYWDFDYAKIPIPRKLFIEVFR